MKNKPCLLFAGSYGESLARKILEHRETIKFGNIYHHVFPSGEHYIQIKENIRGADVFLLQSTGYPANDNFMELLVMIDTAKRASAERITVVIPSSICYARQDRKDKSRTPISAKLIANMITCAGADRLLGMDFHSHQFGGFFDIPVDQLYAAPVFADYLKLNYKLNELVIVSPDEGSVKRSSSFANLLGIKFAFHSKKRTSDDSVLSQGLIGDVKGKIAVLYDDLVESAGTLLEAARVCKESGAKSVIALATHNCLTEVGENRLIHERELDKLIVTDSTFSSIQPTPNMEIISVSSLFAKAIERIHNSESISELCEIKGF